MIRIFLLIGPLVNLARRSVLTKLSDNLKDSSCQLSSWRIKPDLKYSSVLLFVDLMKICMYPTPGFLKGH